jgi:hypothetical protein
MGMHVVAFVAGSLAAIGVFMAPNGYAVAAEEDGLAVSLEIAGNPAEVRVGDTLQLQVVLTNKTSEPIEVQDWDKGSHVISVLRFLEKYPGSQGGLKYSGLSYKPKVAKCDLRSLPPGRQVIDQKMTPLIPGDLTVAVQVWCPPGAVDQEDPKKNVWHGMIHNQAKIVVSAEIPPEIKRRYEQIAKRLAEVAASDDVKTGLLKEVAAEKHYFAARFIRQACDTLAGGNVRNAAVDLLVELAELGTAYESGEFLVGALKEELTKTETRQSILAWVGRLADKDWFQSLGGQGIFQYPQSFQIKAREATVAVAKGKDPYLAAQAREILKKLEEKEKKEKEASKPPAK